jgi:N-acetylglutamate synthase-like GNAT family acetyltransferase
MRAAIRLATAADLPEVERLLTEAELPTAGVAELLNATPSHFFVGEAGGAVIGVAGLEVCRDNGLLRSVAVHPDWRRHGLGRDLVQRVVSHAQERGVRALYLLTMTAERYFPRFDFEPIARDAVPVDVAQTLEFRSACPATAVAMFRSLP